MNELSVNFENCYGIRKLEYTFNFSQKRTFERKKRGQVSTFDISILSVKC